MCSSTHHMVLFLSLRFFNLFSFFGKNKDKNPWFVLSKALVPTILSCLYGLSTPKYLHKLSKIMTKTYTRYCRLTTYRTMIKHVNTVTEAIEGTEHDQQSLYGLVLSGTLSKSDTYKTTDHISMIVGCIPLGRMLFCNTTIWLT